MNVFLGDADRGIARLNIEIVDTKAVVVKESSRAGYHIDGEVVVCSVDVLGLMAMTDQDMVNIIFPDQIQVPSSNTIGEGPVRIGLIFRDLKGKMVVRNDDLLSFLGCLLQFLFEPGPLSFSVVLELGQVGHQSDRVQLDESIAVVRECRMVAHVIVDNELLKGLNTADVMVARQKVNFGLEFWVNFLEALNFVVITGKTWGINPCT